MQPLTTTLLCCALAATQDAPRPDPTVPTPPAIVPDPVVVAPTDRRDGAGLAAVIDALVARHPKALRAETIGTSAGQRPIRLLSVSADAATADSRPAILVVAGMDGHRWSGTETVLAMAELLATSPPAWLSDVTLYLVPRANPDAAERFMTGPRRTTASNGMLHDNDHDGRSEEDPPVDLDGDGRITQLRAPTPILPWPAATLVSDPAESRLLRTPDPAAGTPPAYTVWTEGFDHDGDGLIAEDWPGGIDPERNFPHRWPELEDEAGAYALFAQEAKALATLVERRRNVFAALVIGRHDTVVRVPDTRARTAAGLPEMLDEGDAAPYGAVARAWVEATGQRRADGADTAGSFTAWMNVHRGIPTFATTLWGRPDLPEPEGAPAAPKGAPKPADEDAALWLRYSDTMRGGSGFVPWKPVQHPQLQGAEVGGWVAGFRENPPVEEVLPLAEKCGTFLGRLAAHRPEVELAEPRITELAPGVWRIEATVVNRGKLPTVLRPARNTRIVPPHTLRVSVPATRVRAGRRMVLLRGIDPGQRSVVEWVVTVTPGEPVAVTLARGGDTLAERTLQAPSPAAPAGAAP